MRSVMAHQFSQVPKAMIPRSSFNRTCGIKTTLDSGYLVPIYCDEVLPGDTVNMKLSLFARMQTPIVPVMDNLFMDVFFFFVPNRLVWTNWKKFNGEQDNPGDSTSYLVPYVTCPVGGWTIGSLADYFGIPTGIDVPEPYNALFFRSYNLIYNEWFRDQNMQNSVTVNKGDGPDANTDYTLLRRGKRHDYFTSCLPWPQKGTAVSIPLGTTAPVLRTNSANAWLTYRAGTQTLGGAFSPISSSVDSKLRDGTGGFDISLDPNGGLYTDLGTATAATINQLRQAFQIQKLYERDARGGTRYTEIIRAHFGVISPDARLQRPEFIGSGSIPINIHPIPQTSATGATGTPQGNLAAMATVSASFPGFTKSFTEHGILMCLVSVRADLSYQQGLDRMWTRRTRADYYWPALSHIGEQAVLNREIYMTTNQAQNAAVFGYQERYAEYRYRNSMITGKFRSTAAGTLNIWHLAQNFTALPTLNSTFIQENPPISRVVAVTTEPQFLVDGRLSANWARPMPTYSVPGLIDHF